MTRGRRRSRTRQRSRSVSLREKRNGRRSLSSRQRSLSAHTHHAHHHRGKASTSTPGVTILSTRSMAQVTAAYTRFAFAVLKTTNVDAPASCPGMITGTIPLDFKPAFLFPNFNEIAQSYDQFRIDHVDIKFTHVCYPGREEKPESYQCLFAYDPDGYTTDSGGVTLHGNAKHFTLTPRSESASSEVFRVQPAYVESDTGRVVKRAWHDVAEACPIHHIGAIGLWTPTPPTGLYIREPLSTIAESFEALSLTPNISQLPVSITYVLKYTFKGQR